MTHRHAVSILCFFCLAITATGMAGKRPEATPRAEVSADPVDPAGVLREAVQDRIPTPPPYDTPPQGHQHQLLLHAVLKAVAANDHAAAIKIATPALAAELTPDRLRALHRQVGGRLNGGYAAHYLGYLRRNGTLLHLWKLAFVDSGDDGLIEAVLEGKQLAAFQLR